MGDSKSEVGWRGKTGSTAAVGDTTWTDKVVDVGIGSSEVNAGMVKFKVSDRTLGVEGKFGLEGGKGIEITSDVEAMVKVAVGDGVTEGVTGRNTTSVLFCVAVEPTSGPHAAIKAKRQMIARAAFPH
jgi:hypothetical protein